MSLLITKNYESSAYLKPVANLHNGFRFTYRPATNEERANIIDATSKAKSSAGMERVVARALEMHVKSWSIPDEEPTAANLLILHPNVFSKVSAIVIYGTFAGDEDPDSPETPEEIDGTVRADQNHNPYTVQKDIDNSKN